MAEKIEGGNGVTMPLQKSVPDILNVFRQLSVSARMAGSTPLWLVF
jgi:hypothetical protein